MREAKSRTSWTEPDTGYEAAVLGLAARVLDDGELTGSITGFVAGIAGDALVNSLGAKLVQLTMPGVPDIYQGCELAGLSLVDPDNRRPVDFARRRELLATWTPPPGRPARPGPRRTASTRPSCWSPRARCGCAASIPTGSPELPAAGRARAPRPGTRCRSCAARGAAAPPR